MDRPGSVCRCLWMNRTGPEVDKNDPVPCVDACGSPNRFRPFRHHWINRTGPEIDKLSIFIL
jgi:hypothetical protein